MGFGSAGPNANLAGVGGFTFAAGGQKISQEIHGKRWDLRVIEKESTHEVEK